MRNVYMCSWDSLDVSKGIQNEVDKMLKNLDDDFNADGRDIFIVTIFNDINSVSSSDYGEYKETINKKIRNGRALFSEISLESPQKQFTPNKFFRDISKLFQNEDRIYMNLSGLPTSYALAMYLAALYVAQTTQNTSIEQLIYSSGKESVCDISGLAYIGQMLGFMKEGERTAYDMHFNMILEES